MGKAVECLENALESESCAGDEFEDELKSGIEGLKQGRDQECSQRKRVSEDDEVQKCFEDNEEYFFQCAIDSAGKVLGTLKYQNDVEDRAKCYLFMEMGQCLARNVEETCGSKAALEVMIMMSEDVPVDVVRACESIGIGMNTERPDGEFSIFSISEKKKK